MGVEATRRRGFTGPVFYAAAFLLALPAGLVWWARTLDGQLPLPVVHHPIAGAVLVAAGSAIWAAGVLEIILRGRGLPMNAYPPERYVASGIFAIVAHPIYIGWTLACAGVAVQTGSAAGLWIVTPSVAAGCAALVLGYERQDLRQRFGDSAIRRPWLSLPADGVGRAPLAVRVGAVLPPALLWSVLQLTVSGRMAWVDAAVVLLAALLAPHRTALRRLVIQGWSASALLVAVWLVSPALGGSAAFRVLWAAFAVEAMGARSRVWAIVALVGLAALVVGLPGLEFAPLGFHDGRDHDLDMLLFAGLVVLLRRPQASWRRVLDGTQWLANAWRAWRLGPLRIISHGVFAGVAAAVGVLVIGSLAGPSALPAVVGLALATLVGAALWAQLVEGSPVLLRPFGYYGGVIGGLLGCGAMAVAGVPVAALLAAAAVAAPWVQGIGRLRCLVQGCCHGQRTEAHLGIRVTNPHSRAVALERLADQPIHATQLYSVAGNAFLGLVLARAWVSGMPVWFVTGLYLMGAGLVRFVEEAYRGESQTIRWRRLPMYQYLSLASLGLGMIVTTWGGEAARAAGSPADPSILWTAAAAGAVFWFAMGVDFPDSTRRFARLSG